MTTTAERTFGALEQLAATRQKPPAFGSSARDAINSIVDSLTTDAVKKIGALRKELDELEQAMLTNAARAKTSLATHIDVMGSVQSEIARVSDVVNTIKEDQSYLRDEPRH